MHGTRSKESLYRREFLNLAGLVPVGWAASSLANLWADGTVTKGPYVDGKKHGHRVERWEDGSVEEGPYVDGKRHGHWVERWKDGTVSPGVILSEGSLRGRQATRPLGLARGGRVRSRGRVLRGRKQHGHWVIRWTDGTVWEGPYVDDQEHGDWVERQADGTVYEFSYMDGELVSAVRRE